MLVNADGLAAPYASEGTAAAPDPPLRSRRAPAMTPFKPGLVEQAPRDENAEGRAGFDASLAECRDDLLAYLRKQLGDGETAADLAQEALARMMKYRDAPEIEDRRSMLFRIATNLVAEHHRTQARRHEAMHVPLSDADPLPTDTPSVEAIVEARRMVDLLIKRAILGLPPRCALAFTLSRFDGLSHQEIANIMGISAKMVEKHVARALVACRAAVGDRDF